MEYVTVREVSIDTIQKKDGSGAFMVCNIIDMTGRKLSCYMNDYNREKLSKIEGGKTYKLKVEQKGIYFSFRMPSRHDELEERVEKIEAWIEKNGSMITSLLDENVKREMSVEGVPF